MTFSFHGGGLPTEKLSNDLLSLKYPVQTFHIDMPTYMVGQEVVLLPLESGIVEGLAASVENIGKGLQKVVDEGSIVEDTVDISTHTLL